MKTIKLKSSYLLSTALFLSLVVTSCDLNEIPTSFVEPKDYYQSKEQCEAGLNACYIPLNPIFNYTYLIAMEGCTDLMYVASGTHDAQLAISPANPLFGSTMWTQGYKGVMYANSVVAGIQRAPLADGVKLPMLAEGMVMRAFYYYFLHLDVRCCFRFCRLCCFFALRRFLCGCAAFCLCCFFLRIC